MRSGSRTVVSFLAVAMAATAVGAVVQSRSQASSPVFANAAAPVAAATADITPPKPGTPLTFDTFRAIARDRNAGVVNITTSKVVRTPRGLSPFDFFGEDFFGQRRRRPDDREDRGRTAQQAGSGFIIDKDGYILTNNHVVGDAEKIQVTLSNGREYQAKRIGTDARTDLALIKIEPKEPLTVLDLGDSDRVEVGEWVMAIGQPFGLENSVSVGVISFKGRDLTVGQAQTSVSMLQTDAAINPGNSGGPLLDTGGRVVGINTMIATNGAAANAGVGFAVAINAAKQILPQLRTTGKVIRGWMGVSVSTMTQDLAPTYGLKEAMGAQVGEVTPGSPAEKGGILPEDVILEVDGRPIKTNGDLTGYITGLAPGTVVKAKVIRGNVSNEKTVSVTLGTFPDSGDSLIRQDDDKASLGMRLRDLTPQMSEQLGAKGVLVTDVEPGSAAEEAGLTEGHLIVSVNGTPVERVGEFEAEIAKAKSVGTARLRVRTREGRYFIAALRVSS